MELHDYWRIVRKNWLIIVAFTLLGIGFGAVQTIITKPTYQATAIVYVSFNTTTDAGTGELVQGVTYAQRAITSYVDVTETAIVVDRVAAEIGDGVTPDQVSRHVSASIPKDTTLINISATDSDPTQAARMANTTAAVLGDVVESQLEKPEEGAASRVNLEIINPAQVPGSPVSPNPTRNLTLGFLLGVMLGVGVSVLRDVLDTRIRTRDDVRAITTMPVIGNIPDDPEAKTEPLIKVGDTLSPRSEPFRTLRTNLQFLDVEGYPRSFVISSSLPSEGKTTAATNLAVTLAEAGSRVALVDADLRKPRLATYMGLEGAVGLTDLLIGKATFEDALQKWGKKQLFVLPAGQIPPNPSELLGSKAMQETLGTLSDHFDYVIVDAPPILMATDAAVISQFTGGVLMVVASGRTKKQELAAALETLRTAKARVLGIILTMLPTKGPDAYRYSTYSYQHYGDLAEQPHSSNRRPLDQAGNNFRPTDSVPLMERDQ